jgi:hypothetical protein
LSFGQDLAGVLGPGEQLATLVPAMAELADRRDQLLETANVPRCSAWRWMIAKNTSTRFSHDVVEHHLQLRRG